MIASASALDPSTARRGSWLFVLAALTVVLARWGRTTGISNDGIQYVEGARQLLAGKGYSTGILYFDEHYRSGGLPAPQTLWPPGTSLAIAVVAALGVAPEMAGRVVARVAFILVAPLVFLLALRLTGDWRLAALAGLWQLGLTEFWMYLASPNSELPFLAASLGALLVLPDAEGSQVRWLPAGLLAGLATMFRYVGFFLLIAMGVVLLFDLVRHFRLTGRLRGAPFFLAAPGYLIAIVLLLRNRMYAGDARGGNTRTVLHGIGGLVEETFRSLVDVLAGVTRSAFSGGVGSGAGATAGLIGLAGLTLMAGTGGWRFAWECRVDRPRDRYALTLCLYTMIYVTLIIWTSSRTMLTYGARYLLPVVPLLLCLCLAFAAYSARRTSQ